LSTTADKDAVDKDENLRCQYREAQEMQRKLLELFWQEPSVIVAIAGAVVVAAYSYITNEMASADIQYQVLRTFLVWFGAFMSWASAQVAIKHRFYRIALLDRLSEIESNLKLTPLPLKRGTVSFKRIWE
jgi:hypothetical protein